MLNLGYNTAGIHHDPMMIGLTESAPPILDERGVPDLERVVAYFEALNPQGPSNLATNDFCV